MFPRSLFQSSFPVFCRRRDRGGIERLKRAVPAGSRAGEKASLRTPPPQLRKLPACFIYMQSHTRHGGAHRHTGASHVLPRWFLWKANNWLRGWKTTAVHPPWAGRTICPVLGNVRLSSERLEDTPPCSEILMPALLLHSTGTLFKACRFMEVVVGGGAAFSKSGGWKPRSPCHGRAPIKQEGQVNHLYQWHQWL